MRPSLVAVLVLSLVGLSGAAMSDGMPAKKHHYAKVKKAKVVKQHHRHGPDCPPEHDDSWAIAEQLNHEEWLRHRQDDLSRRGGGAEDEFSGYDDRYASDYAARDEDYGAWDRTEDDADLLDEAGAAHFQRDYGYEGRARRYVDKKVYKRYSSSGHGYGWDGGHRGWSSSGHGWGQGHGKVEKRVYRSYGHAGGYADHDRYAGGYAEHGDYDRYADDEVYAGGSRYFDERTGRYDAPRHERRMIVKRYAGGHKASRYGHADDRLYDHGDYAYGGYGHGGGYASSSYSSSYGYGDGYAHGGGHGYGGGYRFHYDAGYAGRDEFGYLTWPGKAG